jgi:rubredoxin
MRFYFMETLIAECEEVGETLLLDVRTHELDAPMLIEEYTCCRSAARAEAGWTRVVLLTAPGMEEISAVMEAFRSAIDRVAPGFELPEVNPYAKGVVSMDRYVCNVCGWVYDPEAGDPDSGIPAGTSFEDLPDDWVCPVCGASKAEFTKE